MHALRTDGLDLNWSLTFDYLLEHGTESTLKNIQNSRITRHSDGSANSQTKDQCTDIEDIELHWFESTVVHWIKCTACTQKCVH